MPRRLRTYQTSLGFYDLAIAAPCMKAALEAWGAGSNLFHQGAARETDDPTVVEATMSRPGVVLRRPAGSTGQFAEQADLPDLRHQAGKTNGRLGSGRRPGGRFGEGNSRKSTASLEREESERKAERGREEAARANARAKREKLVAKARTALDAARQEHEERARALELERNAIERRMMAESARWEKENDRLTRALRHASE